MIFGLLGKSLGHSFSQGYFTAKFKALGLPFQYRNFELNSIGEFPALRQNLPQLVGLNVTVPYKKTIIPYLDALDPEAEAVGAVNTLVVKGRKLVGYNTDIVGAEASLHKLLGPARPPAMLLGTGGASLALIHVLRKWNIPYCWVSRQANEEQISYLEAGEVLEQYPLLINSTPVGSYPAEDERPPLALSALSAKHYVFDLIYNPSETALLRQAKNRGAATLNGRLMLESQAEAAWEIWQKHLR